MPSMPVYLPSVDALLRTPVTVPLIDIHGRAAVTDAIRQELATRRSAMQGLSRR